MADKGTTYSVLNQALVPLENEFMFVKGVAGQSENVYSCKLLGCKSGKQWDIHRFLTYVRLHKTSLRDLLEQLGVIIRFKWKRLLWK